MMCISNLALVPIALLMGWCCWATAAEPAQLIFDTDLGDDIDDLGAMVVLHALADAGECEILAMGTYAATTGSVGAMDVVNTYFQRPHIPIGHPGGALTTPNTYDVAISNAFAHDQDTVNAPLVCDLYRQTLAASADGSVTFVTVGKLYNIRSLLQSGPDQYSALTGIELVRRKVQRFVILGGRYPSAVSMGGESNFKGDPGLAQYVVNNMPVPVTFSGFEIGFNLKAGQRVAELPDTSPVKAGYAFFFQNPPSWANRTPSPIEDWPTYDQTAVMYAVRGLGPYWNERSTGHNEVALSGVNIWRSSPDADQRYLTERMDRDSLKDIIENMMLHQPSLTTPDPDPTPEPDQAGLEHLWLYDTDAKDHVGGNDAYLKNGARLSAGSLLLDGVNDYAGMGVLRLPEVATIEVRLRVDPGHNNIQTVLANCAGGASQNGYKLMINHWKTVDGSVIFETGNGTANASAMTGPGVIVPGQWHQIQLLLDRAQGEARILVDGHDETITSVIRNDYRSEAVTDTGRMTSGSYYFSGQIDQLSIVAGKVDPEPADSLVHYWPGDTNAKDLAGVNDGTLMNGAGFTTDAIEGAGAFALDGVNDAVALGAMDLGDRATISAWVKMDPSARNMQTVVANGRGGHREDGYKLFINGWRTEDGRVIFETGNGSEGDSALSDAGAIVPGQWHLIEVSFDRVAGIAQIVVDGVDRTVDPSIRTDFKTGGASYLGRIANGGLYFRGSLDEVMVRQPTPGAAPLGDG
ncbi:MAG: hypothetical protein PF961_15475 [Planctomycetota bacterium]|jgi:inosine-uridine nucleoside N-ribohydrolase|nr:hypothetical protein [Planctomycetota bacterium]